MSILGPHLRHFQRNKNKNDPTMPLFKKKLGPNSAKDPILGGQKKRLISPHISRLSNCSVE